MNDFEELLSSLGVSLSNPFSSDLEIQAKNVQQREEILNKLHKEASETEDPNPPIEKFEAEALEEDILNGIPKQEEENEKQPEEESKEEEVEINTLDDATINDVLNDLGFIDVSTQPEMTEMERDIIGSYNVGEEPSNEDDEYDENDDWDNEDDEYDENQGEGHDIEQEEESSERESAEAEALEAAVATGRSFDDAIQDIVMQESSVADVPDNRKIPLNSPTLLMDDSTSRFSGTEWYNEIQKKRIIIAGQGGIGSNLSFQIARLVPASIILYDFDRVERVNMSGQLFSREDIGKAKVDAVADMITKYTSMQNVYAVNDQFTNNSEAGDIMMCGFDSMSARNTFFHSWEKHVLEKPDEERKDCLFLDGRLSINDLQVFCIRGDDAYSMRRYKDKYLFKDYEAEETVCSLKQTTYMACMIASIITNLFVNFVADSLNPILPYDLPFLTQYDSQNMIFKTES